MKDCLNHLMSQIGTRFQQLPVISQIEGDQGHPRDPHPAGHPKHHQDHRNGNRSLILLTSKLSRKHAIEVGRHHLVVVQARVLGAEVRHGAVTAVAAAPAVTQAMMKERKTKINLRVRKVFLHQPVNQCLFRNLLNREFNSCLNIRFICRIQLAFKIPSCIRHP